MVYKNISSTLIGTIVSPRYTAIEKYFPTVCITPNALDLPNPFMTDTGLLNYSFSSLTSMDSFCKLIQPKSKQAINKEHKKKLLTLNSKTRKSARWA